MNAQAEDIPARLQRYSAFLAQDPGNAGLANEVASLRLRLGEFAEARALLQDALTRNPGHPALLGTLASVAMAANQPDEAIGILQGLLAAGHDHPVARYNLAYALALARRFAEAHATLLPVVDDPQIPEAPVLLARCLHHLGELDEAIRRLNAFTAKHPDHAEALGMLSLLNLDALQVEAARKAAEQALKTNPNDLGGLVTMGSLALETQDDQTAGSFFERAVERHPHSGRAWSGMGLTTMLKLDLPKAIGQLEQAVRYMPNHIGTWHALAWCQLMANDLEGAKRSFEQSMEIDRSFGETHGGLAVVAVMQNRPADAEQAIKRAMRLNPESFAGRFAQSLLLNKSDPAKAQELLKSIFAARVSVDGQTLQEILRRNISQRQAQSKGPGAPPPGGRPH